MTQYNFFMSATDSDSVNLKYLSILISIQYLLFSTMLQATVANVFGLRHRMEQAIISENFRDYRTNTWWSETPVLDHRCKSLFLQLEICYS